jgi:acyl-CoA synthetase (AMP-forming)/AMP-acid ligase II
MRAGRARPAQRPPGRALPPAARVTVLDPETMQPVPWDGETMGEIMFRGNIVMKGYLKNPEGDGRSLPPAAGSTPATWP